MVPCGSTAKCGEVEQEKNDRARGSRSGWTLVSGTVCSVQDSPFVVSSLLEDLPWQPSSHIQGERPFLSCILFLTHSGVKVTHVCEGNMLTGV